MKKFIKWIIGGIVALVLIVGLFIWSPWSDDKSTATPTTTTPAVNTPCAIGYEKINNTCVLMNTIPFGPPVPTATPTATQPPATPTTNQWVAFESEGGIPFNGDAINVDVAPDELEVITAGPISVNGVMLPGGTTRGSVVIFLSDPNMVVHYEGTSVIAGSNWHASYRPQSDPTSESTWRSLAEFTVNNMLLAPNCSYGTGCTTIDVLVVGPSGIIDQWTLSI